MWRRRNDPHTLYVVAEGAATDGWITHLGNKYLVREWIPFSGFFFAVVIVKRILPGGAVRLPYHFHRLTTTTTMTRRSDERKRDDWGRPAKCSPDNNVNIIQYLPIPCIVNSKLTSCLPVPRISLFSWRGFYKTFHTNFMLGMAMNQLNSYQIPSNCIRSLGHELEELYCLAGNALFLILLFFCWISTVENE